MKLILRALFALLVVAPLSSQTTPRAGTTPQGVHGLSNRFIVEFRSDGANPTDIVEQLRGMYAFRLLAEYRFAVQGMAIEVPDAAAGPLLEALRRHPLVGNIVQDRPFELTEDTAPKGVRRVAAEPRIGTSENYGSGVDVAVMDSGIDFQHPDLQGAIDITRSVDCTTGQCAAGGDDVYGHGTKVAGIIAARDNGSELIGVAPGAKLVSVRVFDDAGKSSSTVILSGIEYILRQQQTIDPIEIVNMSFREICKDAAGTQIDCDDDYDLAVLHKAIVNLVNAGATVIAGAGNDRIDTKFVAPAGFAEVIAVSALADSDGLPGGTGPSVCSAYFLGTCVQSAADDTFAAALSNFGGDVDVIAPGVDELLLKNGGGTTAGTGTSFAGPHVAGVAAILLSHWRAGGIISSPAVVRRGLLENGECPDRWFRGSERCATGWPNGVGAAYEPLVRADSTAFPSAASADAAVTSVVAPSPFVLGTTSEVAVFVNNGGTDGDLPVDVTFRDDTNGVVQTSSLTLSAGTTAYLTFSWTPTTAGSHVLTASVVSASTDSDPTNNSRTITTQVQDQSPPAAPSNLTATPGTTSVGLTWKDNASNEANFLVFRCAGATCTNFSQVSTVAANTTTWTNSNLKRRTTYRYYVAARNSYGTSSRSNEVSVSTR